MSFLSNCNPDKEVVVRFTTVNIPEPVYMYHCNEMLKNCKTWSQYLRDLLISDFQYEIDSMYEDEEDDD